MFIQIGLAVALSGCESDVDPVSIRLNKYPDRKVEIIIWIVPIWVLHTKLSGLNAQSKPSGCF